MKGKTMKLKLMFRWTPLRGSAFLAMRRMERQILTPCNHRQAFLLLVLVFAAVVYAPGVANAQDATISGTVTDETGGVLPGVTVAAAGPALAVGTRVVVTDGDGSYVFEALPLGAYTITFILPGFEELAHTVELAAASAPTVDVSLQVTRLLETVSVVAEEPHIFARNVVAEPMMLQQSNITSVTSVVDNLPGVSVQEGDAYGFDDWSSNVAVRGFQVTINEAQIGTTIDGFPNGTSDYWSGSKANRFIDPMNLGGVEVSQGTADIASRSVEALGGTFNFITDDPAAERTYTASTTIGENDGKRFSMRVDTGPLFGSETRAWIAAVRQEATDWVQGSARNEREHVAAKLVSSHGRLDLTSYISYDSRSQQRIEDSAAEDQQALQRTEETSAEVIALMRESDPDLSGSEALERVVAEVLQLREQAAGLEDQLGGLRLYRDMAKLDIHGEAIDAIFTDAFPCAFYLFIRAHQT